MKVTLCERCARPLWEELCAYCKGYTDGVKDTKGRKIKKELITPSQPR